MIDSNEFILARRDFLPELSRWQEMVDTMARVYDAPAAFIVQFTDKGYQVTIASEHQANPYPAGSIIPIDVNIFCRKVVRDQRGLYVRDAEQDDEWADNPEVQEDGFRSYFGLPLRWPDGSAFGTICVMDQEPSDYREAFLDLMSCFRRTIELELVLIMQSLNKAEMLAAMSHELRTPLNAVIGFSEMLRAEVLGPLGSTRYAEYAEHIQASGVHLLDLVNDILDLAKAEAGQVALNEEPLDIGELVRNSLIHAERRAEHAGVALAVEVAPGVPRLSADRRRLNQILLNLLSNAIKVSQRGDEVRIAVHLEPAPPLEGWLALEVTDSGLGMTDAELKRAMQPFVQVGDTGPAQSDGTGLGLPLTRCLLELHGGRLVVDSERQRGTRAIALLPPHRLLFEEATADRDAMPILPEPRRVAS